MPVDWSKYPDDWKQIAHTVKDSTNWVCESCGQQCRKPGEQFDTHKRTLTVAHLNHTESDCRLENLAALCSGCHLRYDAPRKRLAKIVQKRLDNTRMTGLSGPCDGYHNAGLSPDGEQPMVSGPLPCPFCGSTDLHVPFEGSGYYVTCRNCGCTGPDDEGAQDPDADCDSAVFAWNFRKANAPLSRLPGEAAGYQSEDSE